MVAVSLKKKKNFFQAEDGIRDYYASRGLGDVYKRQKPDLPKIEAPKHGISPHAEQCLREIAMILSKPKPDPRAWKQQVLDRAALGEHVSLSAMELAQTSFYK